MNGIEKFHVEIQYRQIDSPEQILRCLNCPFKTCLDCYDKLEKIFKALQKYQMKQYKIQKLLGITERKYFYLKKKLSGGTANEDECNHTAEHIA